LNLKCDWIWCSNFSILDLSFQVPDTYTGYDHILNNYTNTKYTNTTLQDDQIAQDPSSGMWYVCPDFYTIVSCPNCQGPHFRCQGYFSFAYRWV
jgi:hypothetical protein